MVFDITQLKKIRKQIGLTQHQFASKAGISQSLIAKIEAEKLDPTYSKVKKIEQALELLTKALGKEAKDMMAKRIISIKPNERIPNIIKLMNKYNISQAPIIDKDNVIGLVSESSILSGNLKDINNLTANDIMTEVPPIISKNAKQEVIKHLLKYYPLLLVKDKDKLAGLITKTDLIKSLI